MTKARLAITMGDPAGIGPEVTLKALAGAGRLGAVPILVGDRATFEDTAARLGMRRRFVPWEPAAPLPSRGLAVRVVAALRPGERRPGRPSLAGGRAAYAAIVEGVRLIGSGAADALVTAPICKANLVAAGMKTPGHTELLSEMSGHPVSMMMVGARLRVALVTTHLAIRRVPAALSIRRVLETIRITHRALRSQFGIDRPRIAVCGLNPHAGEQGLFGSEEKRVITPAIRAAVRLRIDASGPHAADGLFPHAAAGKYDGVVCMYHDQGLGPFKLLHFADGVNFTAGLPFIRTSPDHGTAYDIAGRGLADPRSMRAALRLAAALSATRETRKS